MYEILKEYSYDDALNFTFYKKVIFDYDSEERYFCLTVKNHECGNDQNILLDFIYDSDDFEEKAQTTIREYLLNYIVEHLWAEVDFYNIENVKIEQLEDGIKINNKVFDITKYYGANDYDALYEITTNYIVDLKSAGVCLNH